MERHIDLFPLQQLQGLVQLLIAQVEVQDGVVNQLGRLIIHAVGQLVQLLGVVAVVLHHIGQQRQRLLGGVVGVVVIMVVAMRMLMAVLVVMGVGMGCLLYTSRCV